MKRILTWLSGFGLAAIVAGCASAPSHFYTLDSTSKSAGGAAVDCTIILGPIGIPPAVDRPQFVVVTSPNRVEFDEFDRWAAPLGDSIARVVSQDLGLLLGTSRVATGPMPDLGPAYRVNIRLERFDLVRGGAKQNSEVIVKAVWAVRGPGGETAGSGSTSAREPAKEGSEEALASAASRALSKLSGDIATVIRAAAREKR